MVMTLASPNFVLAPRQLEGVQPEVAAVVAQLDADLVDVLQDVVVLALQQDDWAVASGLRTAENNSVAAKKMLFN